jgi:hypothetical protein
MRESEVSKRLVCVKRLNFWRTEKKIKKERDEAKRDVYGAPRVVFKAD